MLCKKCGAENVEEAVFCARCGSRIDGKKVCPSCGRLNDEDNSYCNFCGVRIDGKTVCKNCGEAFTGNFCPRCGGEKGAPAPRAVRHAPQRGASAANPAGVLRILQSSLLFGAIVILLAFSFCIGLKFYTPLGRASESCGVFYFLFEGWNDVAAALDLYASSGAPVYAETAFALYAPQIVIFIVYLANITVCVVYAAVAATKFAKNVAKGSADMAKFLLPPVVSSFVAVTAPRLLYSMSSAAELTASLNGAAIAEIVVVAAFAAAAIVFECILNGKAVCSRLHKIIPLGISAVLLAVVFAALGGRFLSAASSASSSASAGVFICDCLRVFGTVRDLSPLQLAAVGMCYAEYIILLVFVAAAAVALFFLLKAVSDARAKDYSVLYVSLAAAASFVFLIGAAVLKSTLNALPSGSEGVVGASLSVGAAPILAFVFSAFALAAAIAAAVLGGRRSKKAPAYVYPLGGYAEKDRPADPARLYNPPQGDAGTKPNPDPAEAEIAPSATEGDRE